MPPEMLLNAALNTKVRRTDYVRSLYFFIICHFYGGEPSVRWLVEGVKDPRRSGPVEGMCTATAAAPPRRHGGICRLSHFPGVLHSHPSRRIANAFRNYSPIPVSMPPSASAVSHSFALDQHSYTPTAPRHAAQRPA
ncbi:hypothetical protein CONPUDRAFT_159478 [Coniophora puteana RWD-64-598 SS2]|uniref:Uncharacterized protein n=1 Tax=Coniophora puteana (strain RWD-64-598) TaxID=741705 RepID=A0A5M3M928_CONPW|nr:uncharacterized protein CONPUDRAFT_159478 [Coniophora puteana RWD-64-598 SS2]EIW75354.1 hypothetical protein CONPUDRAFT_159478 [Coniophora puteana RWD-64-598 SS2]